MEAERGQNCSCIKPQEGAGGKEGELMEGGGGEKGRQKEGGKQRALAVSREQHFRPLLRVCSALQGATPTWATG